MAWSVLANCPLTIRCSTSRRDHVFFFLGGGEAGRGLVCRKHFNYCLVYIFSSFLFDLTKSTGICGPFTRYHRLHVLARFRDSLPVVYYLVVCLCLCVCHLQHLGRWSPEFWDQSLYVSWLRFGYPIPRGSVSSPSTNAPSWIQWKIPPLGCLASSRRRQDGKTCLGFTWSGYAATIPLWVRLIMHESLNVFDINIYIYILWMAWIMRITNYLSTIVNYCNYICRYWFNIISSPGESHCYKIFIMTMTFTSPSPSGDSFGIGICQEQIPRTTPTEETASAVVRRPEKGWSHDGRGLDQATWRIKMGL